LTLRKFDAVDGEVAYFSAL